MAIANVKLRDALHEKSVRDPLTGLFKRRYLVEALRREFNASERRGTGFGLVSSDIDHFKTFNDNHGMMRAMSCCGPLGAKITDCLGERDIACRLEGEEFAILMPGADIEVVEAFEQNLRESCTRFRCAMERRSCRRSPFRPGSPPIPRAEHGHGH